MNRKARPVVNHDPMHRLYDQVYSNKYKHPSQRVYGELCAQNRQVKSATSISQLLSYGVLWAELDDYGPDKLTIIRKLIGRAAEAELLEIHLACGLKYAANQSYRKTAFRHDNPPVVFDPKEVLLMCRSFCVGLRSSKLLTRLELLGTKLTLPAAKALANGVRQSSSLRYMSIQGSRCGDKAFAEIAKAVGENTSINDLCVNGCNLTNASSGALTGMLRAHAQRRNDERWALSLRDLPGLSNSIPLSGLLVVDLSQNGFGDVTARDLADALTFDDWICCVNLQGNRIGKKGACALLNLVSAHNENLVVIDLRDNHSSCDELANKLDQTLSARSYTRGQGKLNPQTQSLDAMEIVAGAIFRWESGHQLGDGTRQLVAHITTSSAALGADGRASASSSQTGSFIGDRGELLLDMSNRSSMYSNNPFRMSFSDQKHARGGFHGGPDGRRRHVSSNKENMRRGRATKSSSKLSTDELLDDSFRSQGEFASTSSDPEHPTLPDFYTLDTEPSSKARRHGKASERNPRKPTSSRRTSNKPATGKQQTKRQRRAGRSGDYAAQFLATFKAELKKSIEKAAENANSEEVAMILRETMATMDTVVPGRMGELRAIPDVAPATNNKKLSSPKKRSSARTSPNKKKTVSASGVDHGESFSNLSSLISIIDLYSPKQATRRRKRSATKTSKHQARDAMEPRTKGHNFLDLDLNEDQEVMSDPLSTPRGGAAMKNAGMPSYLQGQGYEEEVNAIASKVSERLRALWNIN